MSVGYIQNLIRFIFKIFMNKVFLKFIIVGIFSTIINYVCFYIIYQYFQINYILSSSIGYLIGVFCGYLFNKFWTFKVKNDNHLKDTILYTCVYLFSLVSGLSLLGLQVEFLLINPLLANLITIAFTTVLNFIGIKFIVFKK